MSADRLPTAPSGLSTRARRLWRAVVGEYELAASELEVLNQALGCLDRADQAGAVVTAEGVTVLDRYGTPKAHPAADVEARNRALFAAMVRQLGIKVTDGSPRSRRAKPGPKPRSARIREEP